MENDMKFKSIQLLFLLTSFSSLIAQNINIRVEPQNLSAEINQTIFLDIRVENVSNLGGFQSDIFYNTDVIHATSATAGDFIGSTGRSPFPLGPEIDNNINPGKLIFGAATFGVGAGPTGDGILATVEFVAQANGNSIVALQNVLLSDISGQELAISNISNATITVGGGTGTIGLAVTNTNDAGEGSLRWAIEQANSNAGADTIIFKIPESDANFNSVKGVWTIQAQSELPFITDGRLFIDGSSQTNFIGSDTNPNGPEIVLNGQAVNTYTSGIQINSSDNKIKGLVINGFEGPGIWINGNQAARNLIVGNYIGTNAAGTDTIPNGVGIHILNSSENVIGGSDATYRNLISGNRWDGIDVDREQSTNNSIIGNYVGTDVTGKISLGNGYVGINLTLGSNDNTVGGNQPEERNIVSGNKADGVRINGHHNTVIGNYIGTDVSGEIGLGNYDGISLMYGGDYNIIGGTQPGEGNLVSANAVRGISVSSNYNQISGNYVGTDATGTLALGNDNQGISLIYGAIKNTVGPGNLISNNGWAGVDVITDSSLHNTITQNSIFNNSGFGIDLWSGGNMELNPPHIDTYSTGTISGTALANSKVEIFSDLDDEGRIYEGSTLADIVGNFHWTGTPVGPNVTATATDIAGNTSEFSPPYLITAIQEKPTASAPKEFDLKQNFPNPFNPETMIEYHLPNASFLEIAIFNLSGQRIATLLKKYQQAGSFELKWDGRNVMGEQVVSGLYVYQLNAGEFVATKKMMLLR